MNYLLTISAFSALLSFFSFNQSKVIVDAEKNENIEMIFNPEFHTTKLESEVFFWSNKLEKSSNQLSWHFPLAAAHDGLFKIHGQIENLIAAEKYLHEGVERATFQKPAFLRALAQNYVSQHRFCEALELITEAKKIGENRRATDLIHFDILMELGQTAEAGELLKDFAKSRDFQYLIRKAKYEDHAGNLDDAIFYLEEARGQVERQKNEALLVWTYSNLADFYGHQGNVKKSFDYYQKTLELDPANWYALKGIAWIAYSNDGNIPLAKSIIEKIIKTNDSPDLHLFLAELEMAEGNIQSAEIEENRFLKITKNPAYGVMYDSHRAELLADNPGAFLEAITLAKSEIAGRPTAQAYDLSAWIYFKNGNIKEAQKISKTYILNKTFEPATLVRQAQIFGDNPEISEPILEELRGARFELGPVAYAEVFEE